MLLDQRRNSILEAIEKDGFASLGALSELLKASESTIRRDLEYLERVGQIRRTRGGAAYVGDSLTTLAERSERALPQKQAIAKAAAELIEPGEAILLDGGTTTLELARMLGGR